MIGLDFGHYFIRELRITLRPHLVVSQTSDSSCPIRFLEITISDINSARQLDGWPSLWMCFKKLYAIFVLVCIYLNPDWVTIPDRTHSVSVETIGDWIIFVYMNPDWVSTHSGSSSFHFSFWNETLDRNGILNWNHVNIDRDFTLEWNRRSLYPK